MGMPTKHHISLDRCKPARSVARVCNTSGALAVDIKDSGNIRWCFSLPKISSSLRLAERVGTDFNPHSSYGIVRSALLPYLTTDFCHPSSFFSQLAQSCAARVVILSIHGRLSDGRLCNFWQYRSVRRVEMGRSSNRILCRGLEGGGDEG